ncbi:hypothetical protein CROQUDRAFT_99267 [Cronartium quercuum f. sp. fusiforme G11]|uniref:Uncharacterized protein n=1 Tax=Cronartium quercuum f. sp. fusiforme G11 TaxID=708437 RepID=A0A9P6NB34_9BASI|nr:hypothetical protein CROQUDRAFT_99267 [Cronartium quercuum f. sp. fusiforme G11]
MLRSADRFPIIGYRTVRAERDEEREELTRDKFTIGYEPSDTDCAINKILKRARETSQPA